MSQQQSEIEDLRKEVAQLRERVNELESQIEENSNSNSLLDRYDSYVVDKVESVQDAHPRRLMTLYKESGIVDREKRKRRAKRLPEVVQDE